MPDSWLKGYHSETMFIQVLKNNGWAVGKGTCKRLIRRWKHIREWTDVQRGCIDAVLDALGC